MFKFGKLRLENYVLFDEAEFDFGRSGTTVINGLNRNAKRRNEHPSNGSGKSLLTSALPTLILPDGVTPVVSANKVQSKKDGFYRKGAAATLHVTKGEDEAAIKKFLKGQSLRYDITHNGKSLEAHTEGAGKDWLSTFFPITVEQFYSTVYLDSRRPLTLALGSDAQRFEFFNNLFRLDAYDEAQEMFKAVKGELAAQQTELTLTHASIAELTETLADLTRIADGKDDDWVAAQKQRISKLQAKAFRVEQATRKLERLNSVDLAFKFDEKAHRELTAHRRSLKVRVSDARERIEYLQAAKAYSEAAGGLESDLQSALRDARVKPDANISSLIRKLEAAISDAEEQESDYEEYVETRDRLRKKLGKDSYTQSDYEKANSEYKSVLSELFSIRDRRSEFQDLARLKTGKCPTCGSKVDASHAKAELQKLGAKGSKLDKRKSALLEQMGRMESWLKVKLQLDALDTVKKPDNSGLKDARSRLRALEKAEELQSKLLKLRRPVAPDTKAQFSKVKDGEALIEGLKKTIATADKKLEGMEAVKRADSLMAELRDLGFDSIKAVKEAKAEMGKVDFSELTNKVTKVQNALEQRGKTKKKLAKLKERVAEMESNLRRAKVIDAIVTAYGNAGLKRYACADVAKQVEANVNEMSSLVFAEKVQFHFDVTDTKFNVCYSDSRGTFDVRTLNGAGSKGFTLLTLLGLFPLIHSSMRTNILVMDEMDANMDPVSRDRLCNALVPALNEVVDHVVVVTPQDDVYPDALRVEVVKEGKTARLVYDD